MDYKSLIIAAALLLFTMTTANAAHIHKEQWYQGLWCAEQGGRAEVRMRDFTRVDCITEANAVEVDFARKWYEAIGQALYYSMLTGRRAGVLLIIERPREILYWNRMNQTIEHFKLPIDTWQIN